MAILTFSFLLQILKYKLNIKLVASNQMQEIINQVKVTGGDGIHYQMCGKCGHQVTMRREHFISDKTWKHLTIKFKYLLNKLK